MLKNIKAIQENGGRHLDLNKIIRYFTVKTQTYDVRINRKLTSKHLVLDI